MMSQSQRVHFMAELWPKACQAQKWNKADTQKRYDLFAQVLGQIPRHKAKLERGEHISFNDFDNADFDKVKAHCLFLANNLQGTIETDRPSLGDGRRLHRLIEQELRCLALYIDNPKAYLVPILRAKFKGKTDIDDLSPDPILHDRGTIPSELQRCLFTLRQLVQKKRTEEGHTVHQMRILAKVPCDCTICVPRRRTTITMPRHSRGKEAVPTENQPF